MRSRRRRRAHRRHQIGRYGLAVVVVGGFATLTAIFPLLAAGLVAIGLAIVLGGWWS